MTEWRPPEARVAFVRIEGDDTWVGLELPDGLEAPLFPASLVIDDAELLHLDALVGVDGPVTIARTEAQPDSDLAGALVGFQQWWRPDQLEAVLDLSRTWTRQPAPTDDHEHCLLDWTTLGLGGEPEGWESKGDWICEACHQQYVVEDHLHVRTERDSH